MKCPICKYILTFVELSSGGDGLLTCHQCNWMEDPTKTDEEQRLKDY